MKKDQKVMWLHSFETKIIIGFAIVIVIIMTAALFIYERAITMATHLTYEKMDSQASYYLETLDTEISHVSQLQNDFFNDRKLVFLVEPEVYLSDYERREALLSIMERMNTITGVSSLVKDGVLYLPKSDYRISPSKIERMSGEDDELLVAYLKYNDGLIHFDGENFFLVGTGAPLISSDSVPNHVMVITFSADKLKERLAAVSTQEGSGAFLYHETDDILLEYNSMGDKIGQDILSGLKTDENGSYRSAQRIAVNGEEYFVFAGGQGVLGLYVQYMKEDSVMGPVNLFRNLSWLMLFVMLATVVVFAFYTKRLIHEPIDTLLNAFQRIEAGNWKEQILHNRKDEFRYLYDGFNEMEGQMTQMIEEVYVQQNLVQRAQLKQLQAQIAPHFLYNSFFTMSRKIKQQDYDNAEELARHLGNYFKYLSRNNSDFTTLEQEAEHARSYAAIQGTRFTGRIEILFEPTPEAFRNISVPRLILQPLLENAFEHGLENKMRDGLLKVSFFIREGEYLISVEDNGEETSDSCLSKMQEMLESDSQEEITGVCNIHKRLQIYYQKKGGLRIDRSVLGGVRAVIYIPDGGEGHEPEFTDRG